MFTITCESTADLPISYLAKRNISALPYTYIVDGNEYVDDMGEFDGRASFYQLLKKGKRPTTSNINIERYKNFFRQLLSQGDILHIALSSRLSNSVYNAYYAAQDLKKEFPDRRIVVIDSTCGSLGYGLLVDALSDMRDNGAKLDELYNWARENRSKIHHQIFATTLRYYRRNGRIGMTAAAMGRTLHARPLLRFNQEGKLIAYAKTNGTTKALAKTLEEIACHVPSSADYDNRMWVAHSDCAETANKIVEQLKTTYPKADVKLFEIGPVIGAHCGQGTVAVCFFGDERQA